MNLVNLMAELKLKTERLHRMSVLDHEDMDVTVSVERTHLGWEIYAIAPNRLTPYKEA
jgi:hypothetical protein